MKYTILGGRGFIGSALVTYLIDRGHFVTVMEPVNACANKNNLGTILYCVGLTADFRVRIGETLDAHVCLLKRVIDNCTFKQFVYFSSTRVYAGSDRTDEYSALLANPTNLSDFYNLSKIMGEAYCLQCGKENMKSVRLSNVIGFDKNSNNFLNQVTQDALNKGKVVLQSHPNSEKDFVVLDDVLRMIEAISMDGKDNIYNIAAGHNETFADIVNYVCQKTGASFKTDTSLPKHHFPQISIERIQKEFKFYPSNIYKNIDTLINQTQSE
jgi:nucleoside-diphosphate-sugar epimerase